MTFDIAAKLLACLLRVSLLEEDEFEERFKA